MIFTLAGALVVLSRTWMVNKLETELTSGYPQLSSSLGAGMLCAYTYCRAVTSAKEVFTHAMLFSDLCSSNFLWD